MDQESTKVQTIEVMRPDGYLGHMLPVTLHLPDTLAETLTYYEAGFFIADRPYEVVEVAAYWSSNSTSQLLQVNILDGTDGGAAKSVLTGTIDTSSGAGVTKRGVVDTVAANIRLRRNDILKAAYTGVAGGLRNLVISITLKAI